MEAVWIVVLVLAVWWFCTCGRGEGFHIRGTPGNVRTEAVKDYPFVPQVLIPQMTW